MTRALRDIPAVRALAEREARALYERVKEHMQLLAATLITPAWDAAPGVRCLYTEAMLDILTDLTRPASALDLAGVLADHCSSAGMDAVGTVPFTHPAFWLGGSDDDATELWIAADGVSYRFDLDGFEGWDDCAALLAVALHVLGGAS